MACSKARGARGLRLRRWVFVLTLGVWTLVPAVAGADDNRWYRITTSAGDVLGYASREIVPRDDGRDIVDLQQIEAEAPSDPSPTAALFDVPGPVRAISRLARHEDITGRTLGLESVAQNGGRTVRTRARISDDVAIVTQDTGSGAQTFTVTLPAGVRYDGCEGLLPGWTAAAPLECDDFNLNSGTVDHVVMTPLGGATRSVLRQRYYSGSLVSLSRLTLDEAGAITATVQPMFGSDIEFHAATRDEALALHPPYRLLTRTMMKSPYRIPDPALKSHIRYRFAFRGGLRFTLPQTGEQRVATNGDEAVVDICVNCGDGLPSDAAYLAEARRPTAWLQSDAPAIVRIAHGALDGRTLSDAEKMDILRRKTQRYLPRVDFIGHYSALDALRRGAGDCTESAALLAALGRAAGIPTRVANGLVYSRQRYHGVSNVFLPHSWVLAWVDGHWSSFDAALGEFDDTHVAISINDGDDRSAVASVQLAGVLQWIEMQEVRAKPGE